MHHLFATLGSFGLVTILASCGSTNLPCEDAKTCATASAADGGGDTGTVIPPGCDQTADPKLSPLCVDDGVGLFVDGASGSDSNAGTKAAPFKTIGAAIANGSRPRIYVCDGTYPEHIVLTRSISLIGGYQCSTWGEGKSALVAPVEAGVALRIADAPTAILVADLDFSAPIASAHVSSSIGALFINSTLSLLRAKVTAADGYSGENGSSGSNYDTTLMPESPVLAGHSAVAGAGGAEQACALQCTNGDVSTGGKGGNGGNIPTQGDPGKPNRGGGAGGLVASCDVNQQNGGPGPSGDPAKPTTILGTVTSEGWSPAGGAAGSFGLVGQGGGGGGGSAGSPNHTSGGGACGGCGGAPGSAAGGGGASIAVVVLNANVTVADATLISATAGAGGSGAVGQRGQSGGLGGIATIGGCPGGTGGKGGDGGASAGGAGGLSAAIAYKGTRPVVTGATLTPGPKGAKGVGGKPPVNDGTDGLSVPVYEIP